jgi:predicted nucleic acid-binding protein
VLADFLIGAHAATEAMTLITRDRGYAKHFQVAIEDPTERKVDDDA